MVELPGLTILSCAIESQYASSAKKSLMAAALRFASRGFGDGLDQLDFLDWKALRGSGRSCAKILRGPRYRPAQLRGGMQRPVRIAQHLASEQHDVGLPAADDLIGLMCFRDHADGAGQDAGIAANPFCERHLISGSDGNLRIGDVAARR